MQRLAVGAVLLLALLVLAFLLSLAIGSAHIALPTVWQAITAYDPTNPEHIAIIEKRLPRTVVGIVVGCALGLAGALAQGLTRNPIADPALLGISPGSAFAVVVAITVFGITRPAGYLWFAFAGACAAAALVWFISSRGREGATPVKLTLAGAAIGAAAISLVSGVLIARSEALDVMRFWQVGALAGRGFDILLPILPFLVLGGIVALFLGRALNLLALGDDAATGLGLKVGRTRLLVGATLVVLVGAATAVTGPIAFIGLVVPHAVRRITGPDYRSILPYSAPAAAVVLLLADVLARVIARPSEVQVGVVVAVIGAPVFISIIRRGKGAGL